MVKFIFKRTAFVMASMLFVSSLNAQEVDNRANVYVGASNYIFDNERNQGDDIGFLLGGEVPISDRWSAALEYWDVTSDINNTTYDSDLTYFRLGSNYHFDLKGDWQPYVGAGIGLFDLERNTPINNDSDETTLDFGFGVKRYLTENFLLRGDAKAILGFEDNTVDYALNLAIGYVFGSRSKSAPTPAPEVTAPLDTDGDGVMDNADSCRNTPAGVSVDRRGCEVDSDRDGVVDSKDSCPDTAMNLSVDSKGCPVLESSMMHQTLEVYFDTDKSNIKAEYDAEIKEFAEFMGDYSNTDAVIEGHTDSNGAAEYNQGLSERRASAVMNELINEYGVSSSRLSSTGYGESDPVAPNTTSAGRASNRRIDAEISVSVEQEKQR